MKGDKPLTNFIRTNGVYQSTAKLTGEMHAACFMYETYWTYIRFRKDNEYLQTFTSNYDLNLIESIKSKITILNLKLISNNKFFKIIKEKWEDGTFSFDGEFEKQQIKHYYGHFRKDFISGEDELLIIGQDNFSDVYKFIEFSDNLKLEFDILNLFSNNKYVTVNNGLPNFGQTDIEGAFAFEKLERNKFIQPSGTHHLDIFDFIRTVEGDKYFEELRSRLKEKK